MNAFMELNIVIVITEIILHIHGKEKMIFSKITGNVISKGSNATPS